MFALLTVTNGIKIKGKLIRPFLGLCISSALFGLTATLSSFEYTNFLGQLEATNIFIPMASAFYLICMQKYLKTSSVFITACSKVLFICSAVSLVGLLSAIFFDYSLFFELKTFVTKNLIVNLTGGSKYTPKDFFVLIILFQSLASFLSTGYFLKYLWSASRIKEEKLLFLGLVATVLLQVNEIVMVAATEHKYLLPLLSLSYVCEAFRLYLDQQKRSLRKLLTLEGDLVEATLAAELSILAGGVLHDIRNPLSKVSMAVASLRSKEKKGLFTTDMYHKKLGIIESATQRMTYVANQYLDILRGTKAPQIRPASLKYILKEAKEMCLPRMKEAGLAEISIECKDFLILVDEAALLMCMVNLINNASDAICMLEEKWINIKAEKEGEVVNILIQDSGNGIPSDLADKIFQRNFSTKKNSGGTGLGLDVVQSLLKKQNATVSYSPHFSNTTFIVTVPCA